MLSSRHPWWVKWRYAAVACDRCSQRVAFYAWTRPRFDRFAHLTLCLACGYSQVGRVRPGSEQNELPVAGHEWAPACVAVSMLRRSVFYRQHFWAPPAPPILADDDEEDDDAQ